MERPCRVLGCCALTGSAEHTCRLHHDAALAQALGVVGTVCHDCKRKLKKDDWINRASVTYTRGTGKKQHTRFAYRHVACEPKAARLNKKQARESVKPLFEEHDDPSVHR